ncbi:MAG: hypothetical protein Q6361_01925, partial [Candidatus Hermodarchaeota archaeon]|nr:hypothetical protein [Candidatus Hermodarchaeota archaeon]
RIDYVFVTPTITVLSHTVSSSLASDHLPVVVQLQLPLSPFTKTLQSPLFTASSVTKTSSSPKWSKKSL